MPESSDNISERIKKYNSTLQQDMIHLKYEAMAENAYKFFRATCHIFYEDLARYQGLPNSPNIWACGDLHLENFGSFKGNNRFVYFDQNDFDESLLAPAAWELARMTTSILIAFLTLHIQEKQILDWVKFYLKTYCDILKHGKSKHIEARLAQGIVKSFLQQVGKRKPEDLLKKHIIREKKRYFIIIDNKKHFALESELKNSLMDHISTWISLKKPELRQFKVTDAAIRLAGTGSLGVKRYMFLLEHIQRKKTFLLLDMKESRYSALLPHIRLQQPHWPSEAERELQIQTRCQYATAALSSTTEFDGLSYLIQELQPAEDKLDFTLVVKRDKDVTRVIEDMALLTASSQLRSSGRQGSAIADELIEFGRSEEWQMQLLQYTSNYAKKVQADYQEYLADYNKDYFR